MSTASEKFASADLTVGQLNAIVKKLGGHEAALQFLRDELQVCQSDIRTAKKILRKLDIECQPIRALDGQRYLANAKKTFPSFVDSNFKHWKLDQSSHATPETMPIGYEMVNNGTFWQIFSEICQHTNRGWNSLCWTQDQIEEFCLVNRETLRADGFGTFFLFKENENFFVADVDVDSGGLNVDVNRLEDGREWGGENRRRVFVPQL